MAALFVVVIGGECYMRTRIDPGLSNYKQSSRVSNTIHASHLRGAGAERDWAEAMRPHEARRVESALSRRVRQSLGRVRLLFLSLGRMYILFFEMCTSKTRPLTCTRGVITR